jgi:hypothetical protein
MTGVLITENITGYCGACGQQVGDTHSCPAFVRHPDGSISMTIPSGEDEVERAPHILRDALSSLHEAVLGLAERQSSGERLTYFEASPSRDIEAFTRWARLNDAQKKAAAALASHPKPSVQEEVVEAAKRADLGLAILGSVRERVEEASHDDEGRWITCNGCHETVDGQETGDYPYSPDFGCVIGGGCMECGGLGAIWDTTDYAANAEAMMAGEAALTRTGEADGNPPCETPPTDDGPSVGESLP